MPMRPGIQSAGEIMKEVLFGSQRAPRMAYFRLQLSIIVAED
jgi:hypothetical protein